MPSTPAAMDGSFEVVFTTLSSDPYGININGQEVGQSDGSLFLWDALPVGTYEVYVTDANGCTSNTAMVTLTSATAIQIGWSSPGLVLGMVEPEGILQQLSTQGIPFAQVTFNTKKNYSYRIRLQELRVLNTSSGQPRGLFMDFQLVQPTTVFQRHADAKSRWYVANGLSWLQLGREGGELFWHSTLSWQPDREQPLEVILESYLSRQSNIQLGLQYLW